MNNWHALAALTVLQLAVSIHAWRFKPGSYWRGWHNGVSSVLFVVSCAVMIVPFD